MSSFDGAGERGVVISITEWWSWTLAKGGLSRDGWMQRRRLGFPFRKRCLKFPDALTSVWPSGSSKSLLQGAVFDLELSSVAMMEGRCCGDQSWWPAEVVKGRIGYQVNKTGQGSGFGYRSGSEEKESSGQWSAGKVSLVISCRGALLSVAGVVPASEGGVSSRGGDGLSLARGVCSSAAGTGIE